MSAETAPEFKQRWISSKPDAEFPPEPNRYQLIVNYGCPFATRTATARHLLGLDKTVSLAVTAPSHQGALTDPNAKEGDFAYKHEGYVFDKSRDPLPEGQKVVTEEPTFGAYSVREVYEKGHPEGVEVCRKNFGEFLGDSTIPLLVDSKKKQVVSAESADIVKMFWQNREALGISQEAKEYLVKNNIDLFPAEDSEVGKEVAANFEWIHDGIVFGVYSIGYAPNQKAFEEGQRNVFANLDRLEKLLDTRRFTAGNTVTFLDLSLLQALVRFDLAYAPCYKITYRRLKDYKNVYAYTQDIVNLLKLRESAYVKSHILEIYFGRALPDRKSPFVPIIPFDSDFEGEHGRDKRSYP